MSDTEHREDGEPREPLKPGHIRHYPVRQPHGGGERHQVVLITSGPDEEGNYRGFVLGYADQAGQFRPEHFAEHRGDAG